MLETIQGDPELQAAVVGSPKIRAANQGLVTYVEVEHIIGPTDRKQTTTP